MIPNQEGGKPGPVPQALDAHLDGRRPRAPRTPPPSSWTSSSPTTAANDILQIERGVSGDAGDPRAHRRRRSDRPRRRSSTISTSSPRIVGPLPPPPPKNAGELDRALRPAWDEVAFGKVAVAGRGEEVLRQRRRDPRPRLTRDGERPATAALAGDARAARAWAAPASRPPARNAAGYLFLTPWLIGFFGLTLGPTLASLYLSFTDYDLLTPPDGRASPTTTTPSSGRALCAAPLVGHLPLRALVGAAEARRRAGLAMVLDRACAASAIYRAIFYLPSLLGASVAIAVLWRQIFGADGLVNQLLAARRHPRAGLGHPSRLRARRRWSSLADLAVRLADDHLPRRPPADPAGPLRGRLDGRRRPAGGSSAASPCRSSRR